MKDEMYMPSVIDFAYEIIELHQDNMRLRRQIEHHEELEEIHRGSIENSEKHHKDFLGIMFNAVLDPESSINRGNAALIREEAKK